LTWSNFEKYAFLHHILVFIPNYVAIEQYILQKHITDAVGSK